MYVYYIYIHRHTYMTQKQETYCLWSQKWLIKPFSSFEISSTVKKYFSICLFTVQTIAEKSN